ncbi:MAG: hypothetical protein AAFO94_08090 [Bacteroidota bacterium]
MLARTFLLGCCLILFFACSKEELGVMVDYEFDASPIPIAGSTASLTITKGIAIIDEVEFEADSEVKEGETEAEFEIELEQSGLFTFDFIAGTVSPALTPFELEPGFYEEVEIDLNLADDQSEPVVILEGTYTDESDNTTPFRVEFDNDEEDIEAEVEELEVPESATAMIKINPAIWFGTITAGMLDGATVNNDGVILISANSNTELYNKITEKFLLALSIEIK